MSILLFKYYTQIFVQYEVLARRICHVSCIIWLIYVLLHIHNTSLIAQKETSFWYQIFPCKLSKNLMNNSSNSFCPTALLPPFKRKTTLRQLKCLLHCPFQLDRTKLLLLFLRRPNRYTTRKAKKKIETQVNIWILKLHKQTFVPEKQIIGNVFVFRK